MIAQRFLIGALLLVIAGLTVALTVVGGSGGAASASGVRQAPGDLDPTFGASGRVMTTLGSGAAINALALQPDGKILAAGDRYPPPYGVMALARFLPDGRPDTAFGSSGVVTTTFHGINDEAQAVGLQADGKIVLAGYTTIGTTEYSYTNTFALARYTSDGALDPDFGTGGQVTTRFGPNTSDRALALVIAPDGTLLVAGVTGANGACQWAVVRYLPDGALDPGFGSGGFLTDSTLFGCDTSAVLALQPDGKILLAGLGPANHVSYAFLVKRFLADGRPDPAFGMGGIASADCGANQSRPSAVAIQPDGKIVLGTTVYLDGYSQFGVARFQTDGVPDTGFGTGGCAHTFLSTDQTILYAVQPDGAGNVVVAGTSSEKFGLARFLPNGAPDPALGASGVVETAFDPDGAAAHALAIQADGKIVAGGVGSNAEVGRTYFALVRYLGGAGPAPTPTIGPGCLFSDVCPADYWFTPVQYLVAHGAISGYGDNTFRPFNNTTRGQLAKIVVGAEGWPINTTGGPHFTDVPVGSPFYSFVETAYNRGVISGYADGTFRPNANVTRAQVSKIVVEAQGWAIQNPPTPHFTDVPAANAFYGVIETAYAHGILSGYADGTFRPGANATRAQIAKIVYGAVTGR